MIKKILGIFICMLFLFSTLPVVAGAELDKNNEEFILKPNDRLGLGLMMVWGRIIFHGEEYVDGYLCYNVTPIDAWFLLIAPMSDGFEFYRIIDNPCYIMKGVFLNDFITKNYMFLWYFGII
jgi:hypothetical protein